MFNTMMKQLKEIAINEAVEICEKAEFMDKTMFYSRIKNMTVEEISQIVISMIVAYSIKQANREFKVSKDESIIRKVM